MLGFSMFLLPPGLLRLSLMTVGGSRPVEADREKQLQQQQLISGSFHVKSIHSEFQRSMLYGFRVGETKT